ncbi:DUF805 domain-containing protein [Hyphobacterium sp.]|uniref:DUF805 domain-containing protein n=1 Tax=Hyphobacterium sp. TaxID=2004662 RepID=UPI003747B5FC
MNLSHVLFSPNGRISQQEYWIGILILIAANIVGGMIPFLGFFIGLFLIYVGVCVYGKRLHDAGKTAWIHGGVWAVQIVLGIVGFALAGGAIMAALANGNGSDEATFAAIMGASGSLFLVGGLGFLIWIIYTIWVGISAGDPGENRYGPAPGAAAAAAAAPAAPAAAPAAPEPTVQPSEPDETPKP